MNQETTRKQPTGNPEAAKTKEATMGIVSGFGQRFLVKVNSGSYETKYNGGEHDFK